jgi:hypothetical protein
MWQKVLSEFFGIRNDEVWSARYVLSSLFSRSNLNQGSPTYILVLPHFSVVLPGFSSIGSQADICRATEDDSLPFPVGKRRI